jgi:branched-chain amino acid transport system substrate-binding protein
MKYEERTMIRNARGLVAAVAVSGLFLTACGGGSEGASEDEIVLGASGPLSGPYAGIAPFYDGMNAYFNELNASGGIGGHKIRFVVRDDQYNPAMAPEAARHLVEVEGVDLICGTGGSSPYAAVNDYLGSKKIPAVPNMGSEDLLNDHTATVMPSYGLLGKRLVKHAVEELNSDRIAIAFAPDDTGIPFRKGIEEEMAERGIEPATVVEFDPTGTDYSSQAAKLKQSGAEVVLINHVAAVVARMINASEKIGYEPRWDTTFPAGNPELIELTGEAVASRLFVGTHLLLPSDPAAADFRDAMEKHFPKVNIEGNFPIQGWTNANGCAALIEKAVELAGGDKPSSAQILEAMNDLTIDDDYIKGLTWTEETHSGPEMLQILTVSDGEFVTSDPFTRATE